MNSEKDIKNDFLGTGASKKPKNLHIAHRRSPSELTTLMVEQYNLQRQLEQVQAQQKQILQQQQMAQQYAYSSQQSDFMPPPGFRSHSRSSSMNSSGGGHKRTGSSSNMPQGHNRRHSLGLNEAIRAAASQRQNNNRSALSPPNTSSGGDPEIGSFKFPPTSGSDLDSDESLTPPATSGHNRSRSLAYGQNSFKFPPENLVPPNISVNQSPERGHQRKGSHYRTGSRNFDTSTHNINSNWRQQQHSRPSASLEPPQASFVPGHKPRNSSYGGSISSLSQMMPSNNVNGRKSLFAPYLPQSSLPDLISEGRLATGTLRVNKKNRSDAYVSTDGLLDADIFICGSKDRNRALEGDLVAVELLVVDEVWESKKEKEAKKRRKDNTLNKSPTHSVLNDDIHNDATSAPASAENEEGDTDSSLTRRGSLKQRPTLKKNDDVEVEGQSLLLVEEEEINDEIKPLYAGHVVAVVDRIPGQSFTGTLGLLRPAQAAQAAKDKKNGREPSVQTPKAPKIVWFKPTDKKVPLIAIPTEQVPSDFVENHESYSEQLFVASIKRWPITSLHPFGTLISKLGKIDDPNTEIDAILRDNNFLCDEYPKDMTYDLPSFEEEFHNPERVNFTNDYVIAFTPNGEFVDNALHVKRKSDVKIELGFHVVDVAYFIQQGSVLDRKAKKRSSSVFLSQKSIPLYPESVIDAISFREGEPNLAVSVVFEIDTSSFEVEDLYMYESIISPKKLVSYDEFDKILEGRKVDSISSATSDYVKTFSLIAKEFRRQRLDDEKLGISPNLTLLNQIDDEKVRLHLNVFDESLALSVISELSHKVNNAIAAKTYANLDDQALLRRHPLPTLQKMETFVRKAANLGCKIDTTSSSTLQKSILGIEDPVTRKCIETMLYKCMPRAKYFVAGKQDPDSYGHYYHKLPIYTHFTTPLKGYADLIIHRQFKSVLKGIPEEKDLTSLKATADYCNFKKDCAANAQEQAIHLLLSQTVNGLSEGAGQLLVMGTVIQVYESSFDVFLPELGVEKRVHGDQLPLVKAEFDKVNRTLELYWEKGIDSATYIPSDEQSTLSYRSSIKNKYRSSSSEVANSQSKRNLKGHDLSYDSVVERLVGLKLEPPKLSSPSFSAKDEKGYNAKSLPSSPTRLGFPKNFRTNSSSLIESESADHQSGVKPYLRNLITRVEGESYIQEIRELQCVPVLLRAEIGMALPCLTVRVMNPFADY